MCTCCGIPPSTVPSSTRLSQPNTVPDFTVTRAARLQPSPNTTPASTTQKGPIRTLVPSSACGLTTASGWIDTGGSFQGVGFQVSGVGVLHLTLTPETYVHESAEVVRRACGY